MNKILLTLSVAGLTFASYLSGIKLFTSTCAFGESCPYFLGYPACYYGFVLFLLLTAFSYSLSFGYFSRPIMVRAIRVTSALGILFAGYFTTRA